jgi:hypothetical protein
MNHIGMDVHKRESQICALTEAGADRAPGLAAADEG